MSLQTPSVPSPPDPSAEDAVAGVEAGQKPVGSEPEPLVGTGASVVRVDFPDPVELARKLEEEGLDHAHKAEVDTVVEQVAEVEEGDVEDAEASAEAVDQPNVEQADIITSVTASAEVAAELQALESEVGREALEIGITAAGDREERVRAITVASRAAKQAIDSDNANVARARAFLAVEELDAVDSPHGRPAEVGDPWVGERWAPHGDMNIPADSDALNDIGNIRFRALNPEQENKRANLFREGPSVEDEREAENERALALAGASARPRPIAQPVREHKPDPDASEV